MTPSRSPDWAKTPSHYPPTHPLKSPTHPPTAQILKVTPEAIVVKGAVPGKAGNVLEIAPAKILGKNV